MLYYCNHMQVLCFYMLSHSLGVCEGACVCLRVFVCEYLCISNGIGHANRMLGKYNMYAFLNIFMLSQGFKLDLPM